MKTNTHLTQKIFFFLILCLLFTAGVLTVIFSTGKFSNSAFAETYYYQRKSGSLPSRSIAQTSVSCKGLYTDKSTITLGQTVTISGIVSNYGIIKYARVNTSGQILSPKTSTAVLATLAKGFGTIKTTFKPTQTGWYVFEVFAYDSTSCKVMCSPDKVTFKNTNLSGGSCDTFNHWQQTGNCISNGCVKWVEVKNTSQTSIKSCIPKSISTAVGVTCSGHFTHSDNCYQGSTATASCLCHYTTTSHNTCSNGQTYVDYAFTSADYQTGSGFSVQNPSCAASAAACEACCKNK